MAKERGARKISDLDEAIDFNNIVVDDGTPLGKRITKDRLKNLIGSEGAQLKAVQGGTVGSPASLVAPETTEYRWMKASPGEYTFGGTPYSATVGKEWIFEWLSGTWSLKDMGPLQPVLKQIGNGTNTTLPVSEAGTKEYVDDKMISKLGTINNVRPTVSGTSLTIPEGFVVNNKSRLDFTGQSISIPAGVFRLLFVTSSKTFVTQGLALPVDTQTHWDLGGFYLAGDTLRPIDTTSIFIDWFGLGPRNIDSRAEYNGTPTSFNYDFIAKKIITRANPANIVGYRGSRKPLPEQTIDMSEAAVQFLYFRPSTGKFNVFDSGDNMNVPKDDVWMATYRPSGQLVTMIGDCFAINGIAKNTLLDTNRLVSNIDTKGSYLGGAQYFDYDFINKKIKLTAAQSNMVIHKTSRYLITNQEIDMLTGAAQILYLDPDTGKFHVVNTGATIAIPKHCISLGSYRIGANYVTMEGSNYSINGIPQSKGNGLSNKIIYDMDLDTYYEGTTNRSMTDTDPLYVRDTTPDYVNGLFDALMASAPTGYITKQEIGKAPTTDHGLIPVYAYSFNPPKNNFAVAKEDYMPKVFINCGTHGGEKMTPFVVHDFIKDMMDNWQTKPFLEFCRFNVPFVIVPLLNADGWYKNLRTNMNGVDINRNFSNGWTLQGEGTETYSGTSPFSEVESQIIRDFLATLTDKFIGIDFHNFSANTTMWFVESHNQFLNNVGRAISQVVSRNIRKKYSWIPQDISEVYGYSGLDIAKQGKLSAYMEFLGMYGITLEVGQGLQYNPSYKVYDAAAFACGLDEFGNMLRLILKECALNHNSKN